MPSDRSPNLAFRDGRWNLFVNADEKGAELYDLSKDPSEANNIAADRAEITAPLKNAALKWRHSMPLPWARRDR
jgi:hypothetical protein